MNCLYRPIMARKFLPLPMDDTETSHPEFPTIAPFLLHFLMLAPRFSQTICVPDIIGKEFGFEFMLCNQI